MKRQSGSSEAHPADPLRALLSRAMIADADGPEAGLAARQARHFLTYHDIYLDMTHMEPVQNRGKSSLLLMSSRMILQFL